MTETAQQTIEEFVTAVNQRREEELVDLFDPSASLDAGPAFAKPFLGHQAIRSLFRQFWDAIPGLTLRVSDLSVGRFGAVATVRLLGRLPPANGNGNGGGAHVGPEGTSRSWTGTYVFSLDGVGRIVSLRVLGERPASHWLSDPSQRARLTGVPDA